LTFGNASAFECSGHLATHTGIALIASESAGGASDLGVPIPPGDLCLPATYSVRGQVNR
jgi:hypothetical protein